MRLESALSGSRVWKPRQLRRGEAVRSRAFGLEPSCQIGARVSPLRSVRLSELSALALLKLLVIHLRLPRTYATVLFFNVVVPASVRTCDDSCLCPERKSYLSFVALWY